jgi:hypothetical protein
MESSAVRGVGKHNRFYALISTQEARFPDIPRIELTAKLEKDLAELLRTVLTWLLSLPAGCSVGCCVECYVLFSQILSTRWMQALCMCQTFAHWLTTREWFSPAVCRPDGIMKQML